MTAAAAAFDLHGIRIELRGDAALAAAAAERLAALPTASGKPHVVIRFVAEAPPADERDGRSGRVVYESRFGPVRYLPGDDELRFASDSVALRCSCGTGDATIWVHPGVEDAHWLASRPMLSLVLFEVLRAHDLYVVHAAAAAVGRCALLLAGDSGHGKSTLALALARAGVPLLGDDIAFLAHDADGGVVLHGFPEPIDVLPDGARLFPELPALRSEPPPGWPKHRVPVDAFGPPPAATAVPGVVVVLDAPGAGHSELRPLAEADALLRLAPNVLLTHIERSQRHLDALGRLVATARCYRLRAGDDLAEAVATLVDLVEAAELRA